MNSLSYTLRQISDRIGGEILSGPETAVTGAASIETARAGDLVRVDGPRHLLEAERGPAAALLVGAGIASSSKPAIRVPNARLAFARALELFAPPEHTASGVHPTAVLGRNVRLGTGCVVMAYAVVEDDAVLGDRVVVHPHCVVGMGSNVGDDSVLFAHVTLYPRVRIGRRVRIHSGSVIGADGYAYEWDGNRHYKIPSVGGVEIHDDVEIGANTCVDRATCGATVVGPGTKIDNFVQVAHNVRTGAHCLLIAASGIAGSSKLGNGVLLSGAASVRDHVTLGDGARIGMSSTVWKDVPPGAEVSGTPARPHREQLRILAAMGRLARETPPDLQK